MSIELTLDDLQRDGFPMGAEPLAALDLVDTTMLAADPEVDLLDSPARNDAWWNLQLARLPDSPVPDLPATKRLRTAVRDVFDAHLEGRVPAQTSVDDLNAAAASVPTSPRLAYPRSGEPESDTRWHTEHGGNPALAAIAREAIELLTTPDRLARLRRCANPTCSMLFIAETTRRQWCTANICGNRMRVARHYQRTHTKPTD